MRPQGVIGRNGFGDELRRSVSRLALGVVAAARFITKPEIQVLVLLTVSDLAGALLSATNTSPFGKTSNHRGWSSPLANAFTWVPAAGVGFVPDGQPIAGAM